MPKCSYREAVRRAYKELGYLEKRSNSDLDSKTGNAGSANWTKYARDVWFACKRIGRSDLAKAIDYHAAWCDLFVDCCVLYACKDDAVAASAVLCGKFDDYTVNSAAMYEKAGRYGHEPELAAQIFFANSTGIHHTGIITGYGESGYYVRPIEGNTSSASGVVDNGGGVAAKKYDKGDPRIHGYGYPKYADTPLKLGYYTLTAYRNARQEPTRYSKRLKGLKKGTRFKVSALRINKYGWVWGYVQEYSGWVCLQALGGRKFAKRS